MTKPKWDSGSTSWSNVWPWCRLQGNQVRRICYRRIPRRSASTDLQPAALEDRQSPPGIERDERVFRKIRLFSSVVILCYKILYKHSNVIKPSAFLKNSSYIFYIAREFTNIYEVDTKNTQTLNNNSWITQTVVPCEVQTHYTHYTYHYAVFFKRQLPH